MGVTDILRGEDHVSNTALQAQMFEALGAGLPRLAHEALIVGGEGVLSKRLGSLGVEGLRETGIESQALRALLARIGTSQAVDPAAQDDDLAASFDLAQFGRAPARFDEAELRRVNAAVVHALPYDAVAERLPEGMDETAWLAIRANLAHVGEAAEWWSVVKGPIALPDLAADDRAYLKQAAACAGEVAWDEDPWHALTAALKQATGRKGRGLFLPLRLALTGREHGPEMAALLPLIGRDEAVRRLMAAGGG
jgi:glutamyl-tRNA synthetase